MNAIFTNSKFRRTSGFTLVELMVAMTITLLLMAGLAKSFGVIGQSIKAGRSQVTLSSKLRNLSFGLRGNFQNRTVNATPPIDSSSGAGYFMYYEGPLTEHTFGMYGAAPERVLEDGTTAFPFGRLETLPAGDPDETDTTLTNPNYFSNNAGPTYRRHGRIGDFDDYIAFTAEATGDQWFTGKVPAYLVTDGLVGAAAMTPVVIRSKYAEIITWASPRWAINPTTNSIGLAPHPSAMPLYKDDNLDLVPDGMVLHQRILLIRPDLNANKLVPGPIPFQANVLRPQNDNPNPYVVPPALQRIYPIGITNPTSGSPPPPLYPNYVHPSSNNDNQQMLSSNWLVGMAPLHHFFDLSLRRVIDPTTGIPTGYVAANSLTDLVQPHNRFAHVRYPGRYFGTGLSAGVDNGTSMPLLALGWNDAILNWQGTADPRADSGTGTQPAWFPTSHVNPRTLNRLGTPSRSGLFNGWLLPHFELGNPNSVPTNPPHPNDVPATADQWRRGYLVTPDPRWDRTGEDVLASNVLAFDVRAYDRTAPVFVTSGPDGQPGRAGVDDDRSGTADETISLGTGATTELGAQGSDDEMVGVTDAGIFAVLGQPTMNPTVAATHGIDFQAIANQGAFVDLSYPYLAGSPIGIRTAQSGLVSTPPPRSAVTTGPRVGTNFASFMGSELSLFPISPSLMNSIKRSGKLVHTTANNGSIAFFQPTYDTWTTGYAQDGFDQSPSMNGAVAPAVETGTIWLTNSSVGASRTPLLQDPITDKQPLQVDTARLLPDQPETSPPINSNLPAISVTIRVFDPGTEEMTQFTLVEELQ